MKIESYYRFKVGEFECVSISDGGHKYPLKNFFANVPIEQVEEVLRQRNLPTDHIWTPYTYLFVNTGEHQVLVDMGAGSLVETTGKLLQNMEAAQIEPAAIDSIFITHAHPDHIGGMLDKSGNPVYANAWYFIWREEWQFWFSETASEKANESFVTFARKHLEPVKDRVNFVTDESHILPGVHVLTAPGHTPGHMVVSFSSGDEQLLYIGDSVLHPLHLEQPNWLPVYDILPEKAAPSKRRIFDYAADEQAWVIGQHFPPFPSLGHIVKQGEGWQWQPIEIEE
jgi:glyoxylase-like metal-dependent hydrolase (beta-lactamase superfamily II)